MPMKRARDVPICSWPAASQLSRSCRSWQSSIATRVARIVVGGRWARWIGRGWARLTYATRVEPTWLELNRHDVHVAALPSVFDGFRIAQLSDLHCSRRVTAEYLGEAGYEITPAEVNRRFAGMTSREIAAIVEEEMGRPLPDKFFEEVRAETDIRYIARNRRELIGVASEVWQFPDLFLRNNFALSLRLGIYKRYSCAHFHSRRLGPDL